MNKILWPMVIFCLSVTVYWMFTGIGPMSVPVIKPSNFVSSSEMADALYSQTYPRILNYKSVVIGTEDNRSEQHEFLIKFSDLIANGFKVQTVVLSDTPIKKEDFSSPLIEVLYLNDVPEGKRRQTINEFFLSGKRLIFSLSTFDSAHFRRESMINVIDEGLQIKSVSFVMARIALNPREITIGNLCGPPARDEMDYNPVACLVKVKSEDLHRTTKIKKDKMVGIVERQGEHDFMVYTWVP